MPNTYGWKSQLAVGARGVERVATYLREHGFQVQDVTADKDWRHRDVDLLVRGKRKQRWKAVEVKTDSYTTGNIFLELVASSGRPGCVFVSRADVWCYWLSALGILLLIELPALQYWLMCHADEYRQTQVNSSRGNGRWSIRGIAVPWSELHKAGIAHPVILGDSDEGNTRIQAA